MVAAAAFCLSWDQSVTVQERRHHHAVPLDANGKKLSTVMLPETNS